MLSIWTCLKDCRLVELRDICCLIFSGILFVALKKGVKGRKQ